MERLDFDHYLVEYWFDGEGKDYRWALEASTHSLEEAREVYARLRAEKRRARIVKVIDMGWE